MVVRPIEPRRMDKSEVTLCLEQLCDGDRTAVDRLLPHIYNDLRALAERVAGGSGPQSLQPTMLVHDAYLRLVRNQTPNWEGRRHFFGVAAKAMRQLLADHARRRRTQKRGGERHRVTLTDVAANSTAQIDLVALDDALTELHKLDERQARIVELRYLTGLTIEETADVLGIAPRTVNTDWRMARSWMQGRLEESA